MASVLSDDQAQFLRVCKLIVYNKKQTGLDLSQLHIKFSVKRSDTQTPNSADIMVYNLDENTAQQIKKEFTKVVLQAGYESNFGVIFQGNIKQVLIGRENATDTYLNIIAGDGDNAYNFAIVNQTLAAGCSAPDQIKAALDPMQKKDVSMGTVMVAKDQKLPRGKVMYGASKKYLRSLAATNAAAWSIQDGKLNFLPLRTYLKGEAVLINSKTGMIGRPEQTNEGLNVKTLLNPLFKISGRVKINNADVAQFKINLTVPGSPANTPPQLREDGYYYIMVVEYVGDTRGQDWFSSLTCLTVDVTSNPLNAVQNYYGPGL
jgi:hypothetical protein